jgi:hypothetical protein
MSLTRQMFTFCLRPSVLRRHTSTFWGAICASPMQPRCARICSPNVCEHPQSSTPNATRPNTRVGRELRAFMPPRLHRDCGCPFRIQVAPDSSLRSQGTPHGAETSTPNNKLTRPPPPDLTDDNLICPSQHERVLHLNSARSRVMSCRPATHQIDRHRPS